MTPAATTPATSTVTVTASPSPVVTIESSDAPDISFVFVGYGTGPILIEAITSLAASLDGTATAFEVIVVDNAHPHTGPVTRRALRLDTSGVVVIDPAGNTGFGGGCELGAWHARGDVLAFVNCDLTFVAGWLEPARAALDEPAVSIVAPILLDPDGTVQEAGGSITPAGWTLPNEASAGDGAAGGVWA